MRPHEIAADDALNRVLYKVLRSHLRSGTDMHGDPMLASPLGLFHHITDTHIGTSLGSRNYPRQQNL